ncbi:hypothetical protein FA95DRAFT_1504058 [Auriscalpium vulgare]|uniref:Uncharacterized protein n=1 Tax=Auriscalpium vulgare TaxID=40419 RepID=A0ACB8R7H7_9AGAM|nr:hypothetical protein FA95DRAFT_1504058 [Auriscalpium vulgare]
MEDRPTIGSRHCLAAYVTVNGTKAYTLFDSGSTTLSITPDFAKVNRIPLVGLKRPVTLQLGCVGSRTKINFGAKINLVFGPVSEKTYADVVNIDRYDMIIGTPFLRAHGVSLDFSTDSICVKGQSIPSLTVEEERTRNAKTGSTRRHGESGPSRAQAI